MTSASTASWNFSQSPGRIVEAAQPAERVIAVVPETGIAGNLLPELHQLVEDLLELLRLLQPPVGDQFPRFLAQRTVGLFQVAAHLDQRLLLAAELHGERAAELLILLAELGFLGLQRHVLLAEQLDLELRVAVEHLVALLGQLCAQGMGDVNLGELELARLELRLHVLHEVQVGLLRLGVVRVARHGDVTLGGLLIHRGAEFAPIQQPPFQVGGGGARWRAGFELVKERSDLAPVSQVNLLWHKAPGLMRRQRIKWQ